MFCDFYFDSDYSFEKQKKMVLNKFIHSPVIRLYDSIDEMLLRNSKIEEFIIVFDAFCFEMTPVEDYQKFKSEEYGIKIDIQVHFDIYTDVADWDKEMMKLLNYLIRDFVNNCILEYYAIPVLKIINGNVEVDESRSGRTKGLPFDILDCIYCL
ncbi:MAG: hypothetical protein K2N46_10970 [Lachnospiraceae bacterium]|nr:hypothetical protein [Lachnospiraceae bacterium]